MAVCLLHFSSRHLLVLYAKQIRLSRPSLRAVCLLCGHISKLHKIPTLASVKFAMVSHCTMEWICVIFKCCTQLEQLWHQSCFLHETHLIWGGNDVVVIKCRFVATVSIRSHASCWCFLEQATHLIKNISWSCTKQKVILGWIKMWFVRATQLGTCNVFLPFLMGIKTHVSPPLTVFSSE